MTFHLWRHFLTEGRQKTEWLFHNKDSFIDFKAFTIHFISNPVLMATKILIQGYGANSVKTARPVGLHCRHSPAYDTVAERE